MPLPPLTSDFLAFPAHKLLALLASGEVSSQTLTEAFIARITQVEPQLNAMAQPPFELAMEEARAADALHATGKPLGPLHGLPITVKEQFQVAGMETTIGLGRKTDIGSKGLPVAVQVVGRHWHDAEGLAIMQALENHFSLQQDYPIRLQP